MRSLAERLQTVYDVLLEGTDEHPEWDRLIGLSAVGEAIEKLSQDPIDVLAAERGWNPLTVNEKMVCTIEKKVYRIRRLA